MFQFMLVVGLVLAYYGYAVTKNPRIWGDQGRDAIKEERDEAMQDAAAALSLIHI